MRRELLLHRHNLQTTWRQSGWQSANDEVEELYHVQGALVSDDDVSRIGVDSGGVRR